MPFCAAVVYILKHCWLPVEKCRGNIPKRAVAFPEFSHKWLKYKSRHYAIHLWDTPRTLLLRRDESRISIWWPMEGPRPELARHGHLSDKATHSHYATTVRDPHLSIENNSTPQLNHFTRCLWSSQKWCTTRFLESDQQWPLISSHLRLEVHSPLSSSSSSIQPTVLAPYKPFLVSNGFTHQKRKWEFLRSRRNSGDRHAQWFPSPAWHTFSRRARCLTLVLGGYPLRSPADWQTMSRALRTPPSFTLLRKTHRYDSIAATGSMQEA